MKEITLRCKRQRHERKILDLLSTRATGMKAPRPTEIEGK